MPTDCRIFFAASVLDAREYASFDPIFTRGDTSLIMSAKITTRILSVLLCAE